MELEVGIPVFRPRRKQIDFFAIGLHEHVLKRIEDHGSLALVGYPVEIRAPEGREAAIRAVRFFIGAAHEVLCGDSLDEIGLRLLGQTEEGGLDRILLPTTRALVCPARKSFHADLQIGLPNTIDRIWEDSIQFRVFTVLAIGEHMGRFDPFLARFFSNRNFPHLAEESLPALSLLSRSQRVRQLKQTSQNGS